MKVKHKQSNNSCRRYLGLSQRALWPRRARRAETILLLSDDIGLHETLRRFANAHGQMIVRIQSLAGAVPLFYAIKPVAVLLDLGLPQATAWRAADALLQQRDCPAIILIATGGEHFDLRSALCTGSLVEKSSAPAQLLELVDRLLAEPAAIQLERKAALQSLIRFVKPCSWAPALALHNDQATNR